MEIVGSEDQARLPRRGISSPRRDGPGRGYDKPRRNRRLGMVQQHVFISYRHESPEHARAVRRLAELLRQAKIPVALDQFYLDEFPGGPDLGWPKWSEDCANESACVLIVGSAGWFAAYDKSPEPV